MSDAHLSLACDALPDAELVGFKGVETLNQPFALELFFTVPVHADVRCALSERASLALDPGDGREPMWWHGVLDRIRMLHRTAERALYAATLVPRLARLRQSARSFVHTKETLASFLGKTLVSGGLTASDYRFDIDVANYPEEAFVCQYHETHLDFFHRWLEREGAYYFFEHEGTDGGAEKVIVVDDVAKLSTLPGAKKVKYRPVVGGDVSVGEALRALDVRYESSPATVFLADYDYAKPDTDVSGEAPVVPSGLGVVREYGYRVFDAKEAKRLAKVRAESLAWSTCVLRSNGNALHLRSGYLFELERPIAGVSATRFLAVTVEHEGILSTPDAEVRRLTGLTADEPYRVAVTAIPADVPFRAPQTTAWPRVEGFENGVIDGPSTSRYAQLDAAGRYFVRFKFDSSELPDGSASTYLRMMQPHAGEKEGHHFPLRKSTEVLIAFLGGDIDRPFIAGALPNAEKPSTVLGRNQTQNVIRTGGMNHLVIEDLRDRQYCNLYCPTEETVVHIGGPFDGTFGHGEQVRCTYYVSTNGNAGFTIGGSWWENVSQVKKVHVRGDVTFGFDGDVTVHIGGNLDEKFNANRSETTDGMTFQTYTGALDMFAESGRLDEVSVVHAQVRLSGVNDTVTGTFRESVPVTLELYCGNLETRSKSITINAPAMAVITPDTITMEPAEANYTGVWLKITPFYFEAFGLKVGIGGLKMDVTGLSTSVTGIKEDFPGLMLGKWDSKVDFSSLKASYASIAIKAGAETKIPTTRTCNGSFSSMVAGALVL